VQRQGQSLADESLQTGCGGQRFESSQLRSWPSSPRRGRGWKRLATLVGVVAGFRDVLHRRSAEATGLQGLFCWDDGPWPANAEMSLRRRILGSRLLGWTDQRDREPFGFAISVRRAPLAPTPTISVRATHRGAAPGVRRCQRPSSRVQSLHSDQFRARACGLRKVRFRPSPRGQSKSCRRTAPGTLRRRAGGPTRCWLVADGVRGFRQRRSRGARRRIS
jgi:hypothetical protein